MLWKAIRHGKLGELKFRRQEPIEGFYADFACPGLRLVIEIDGSSHRLDDEIARDYWRTVTLEAAGWHVLRFTNEQVLTDLGAAIAAIQAEADLILGV